MSNLKLIGISTLFLTATIVGLTVGYFSSRKISDDKSVGEKNRTNAQSVEQTNAELTITITKIKADMRKFAISLNAKNDGKVGPVGPQGKTGEKGKKGDIGAPGETGSQGPASRLGERGARGLFGKKGTAGKTGAQGPEGRSGPGGDEGIQGKQGDIGAAGLPADTQELIIAILMKVDKTRLPAEVLKIFATPNPALQSALLNLVKPSLRTLYFDSWIDRNKHKSSGVDHVTETNDIHQTDKKKNLFYQKAGHLFTNLAHSNSYLFNSLNDEINKPNGYGLYGKVSVANEVPRKFYLKKYSDLKAGNYRKWIGFWKNTKALTPVTIS